jgi:hypothetical protein
MKYMLLIYGDEAAWETTPPDEKERVYDGYRHFMGRVEELGGTVLDGAELQSTATATTIRNDVIFDGPFLETREALGGYFVIEADDLDQIIAIARQCPSSAGCVEVRPLNR